MHKPMVLILSIFFSFSSLDAAYLLKEGTRPKSQIDRMPKNSVSDMVQIPQNPSFYANQIKPFPAHEQRVLDNAFNRKYFEPWHINVLDIPRDELGWEVRFVTHQKIYRLDGSLITSGTYEKWIANADYAHINTKHYKAITVCHTDLKALPTSEPFYKNPKETGEGFPFNYNQNSSLHINVPLFVSHFSKDQQWAFVRASYGFGWVKVSDLALVDAALMRKFKNDRYAMVIKDNLHLYQNKEHISIVKVGALFPVAGTNRYYVTSRDPKGRARLETVEVEDTHIIANKPLPFTAQNVAMVAKEFYGEPYGWGGGYECRDCSSTTRDFLGVFGIFLRRNSSKQAQDGHSVFIGDLDKKRKKRAIIQQSEPFRSILYVPGHVVLYLGEYQGEPVIMHTYWGIRKKDGTKLITGRTIITSTEPGKERADVKEESKLINTLQNIINF